MNPSTTRSAVSVGSGILISRATGYVRDMTIAYFFGTGAAAGAYVAALRIPNVLRNLLGEGTLSAAFVPVYSAMLRKDGVGSPSARRLARGVLGAVVILVALLAGGGVLLAPLLTRIVAPGFSAEETALTIPLVRILFPMAGVMILAAWCLGVLNSHRRFFLPFVAPVLWNLSQIAGLLIGARLGWTPLVQVLAWSTLVGSLLQFGVQLPVARRLAGSIRPTLDVVWEPVRRVVRNAGPVAAGQGVFQISSLLDVVLASILGPTAIAGLYYAQRVAYLPLALFGVSVATASLPEMSRDTAADALRGLLVDGLFKILFFVLPSAVLLILFGDLVIEVLFRRGQFRTTSVELVRWILAAYAVGIVASSSVKLFASGFHALQDTVTPMRIAFVAVLTGVASGAALMFTFRAAGMGDVAASGLVLGGALGAWLNLTLLGHGLGRRVGSLLAAPEWKGLLRLLTAAAVAGAAGLIARRWLEGLVGVDSWLAAAAVLGAVVLAGGIPYLLIARRPPRLVQVGKAP